MSNLKRNWFLVPSVDITPAAVRLGHVIAKPTEPRFPLNPAAAGPSEGEVFRDTSEDFHMELSGERTNTIGIWACFLQAVGLAAEAKLSLGSDNMQEYDFKKMTTEWFNPSPAFVTELMQSDAVDSFRKDVPRAPLYVVTGVKVVTGGSITIRRGKRKAWGGKFGVDGTPAGAPISAGPEFEHGSAEGIVASYKKDNPIVFAYQLVRVKIKDGKQPLAQPYNKGAAFEERREHGDTSVEFDLWDVAVDDLSDEQDKDLAKFLKNTETVEAFDDGDEVKEVKATYKIVVPKTPA